MGITKIKIILVACIFTFFATSCETEGDGSNTLSGGGAGGAGGSGSFGNWLIPVNEVRDGGPGKDGIPALQDPDFLEAGQASYLREDDLVVGYKRGNDIRAYSHNVLDWHEIVNDQVGDFPVAITYCPLTGTAIGWGRSVDGNTTTFGVSGLLYNTNLIPYDRSTDSNWSQMRLECVNGSLIGNKVETFQVVETTWGTWKSMYPSTRVISNVTGFNRNYSVYPYGDYRTNHNNLIFSISPDDNRIPRKDRVLGVIVNDEAKVYEISKLKSQVIAINDEFNGDKLVVVGSKSQNFMVAFNRTLEDETVLEFEPVQNEGAVILKDNEGNTWNIFGEAVAGNRAGSALPGTSSFIGYWMAWGSFYPGAEIYEFTGNEY
ncbi:DUF3179 domain-containing protein [Fulvivirgaceae bacterium BMA12]|uniref:DUF3179 domain-containing protein n=1 Tax=Agaribacillus aureus TaxID=3051825 RepID=A0ABT8L6Y2_9BACT|nr:DUF3179 domain-containing protein [Fulvivirgaceae bacterium BMA12]